jgi:hypothetical protein
MLQVEQEFNKLAQDNASLSYQPNFVAAASSSEVAFPTKDDTPAERSSRRRQDSEVSLKEEDKVASLALTETPRRPKPTTLDIPARRALQDAATEEAQSPDTPSYASRPLPMSPRGPAYANIPLRKVEQTLRSIILCNGTIFYGSGSFRKAPDCNLKQTQAKKKDQI